LLTKDQMSSPDLECGQVVDHCLFPSRTGTWQAWVQIRDTGMGRVFTRWEQRGAFPNAPWTFRGVCWQADHDVGESIGTSPDKDVIQAPYVLKDGAEYLLVYGGGPVDAKDTVRQVCLARSADGIAFARERDDVGHSRIVSGPGHAADAFLLKHSGEYYLYIGASYFETHGAKAAATVQRSMDLHNWSAAKVVHAGGTCGTHTHSSQSLFVCSLEGYFYLFKMGWSADNQTAVYRSNDPEDFGSGDEKLTTVLSASACEIINCEDEWYLSSLTIPSYSGLKIAPMKWIEDVEPAGSGDA